MKIDFNGYNDGANAATELVNTSPRVRSRGEALPDVAALTEFFAALGIDRTVGADDLQPVHALRDEVRAALESDEDDLARRATAFVARAGRGPGLHRDVDGHWRWHVETSPDATADDALAVLIGTGLLGALYTLGHDRFRHCTAPDCAGMFVDTSRAGRRRYCMPEVCGNRLKVAKHRARQRDRT
ncbi:CGNR zinc finger domain-containing protein [Prauserella aidingensis]|uniref:CGNR zinc finger domain-containing protein n=1 Tax=Prauserella aidingensis TaxID=387890 RepID=UPI0020A5726B|nr:CGNR zinc finger domain-containing protein [Prauserella aidingensis]MCP2252892.1 CGNR zinc finger domain-containing protein [Prauserella aidingensis]